MIEPVVAIHAGAAGLSEDLRKHQPDCRSAGARNYCARDLEGHLWSFGTNWPRNGSTPDTP
jgi:hypothetical protein